MTLAELRNYIRLRLDDTLTPYQWSDAFLNSAINHAQREAAERALLLPDTLTIALSVGVATYVLPTSTIFVRSAEISNNPLLKTKRFELDNSIRQWELLSGTPKYYLQDGNKITLVGIPDAVLNLVLTLFRYPVALSIDSDVPEIATEYHENLSHFVLAQCYECRDSDLADPNAAFLHYSHFDALFGNKKSAKFMQVAKSHRSNSRVYGRPF